MVTVKEVRKRKKETLEKLIPEQRKSVEEQLEAEKEPPKTPEQQRAEGQAFIQEREKRLSRLGEFGQTTAGKEQVAQELTREAKEQKKQIIPKQPTITGTTQPFPSVAQLGELEQEKVSIPELQKRKTNLELAQEVLSDVERQGQLEEKLFGTRIGPKSLNIKLRTAGIAGREVLFSDTPELAANIIDAATSIFSARKQADVITAEAAFNDAKNKLEDDIELVKVGIKSGAAARVNLSLIESAISRLENANTGLGKINLRYWLGGGDEVEAEIIIFKSYLEDMKAELIRAEQQALNTALRSELI